MSCHTSFTAWWKEYVLYKWWYDTYATFNVSVVSRNIQSQHCILATGINIDSFIFVFLSGCRRDHAHQDPAVCPWRVTGPCIDLLSSKIHLLTKGKNFKTSIFLNVKRHRQIISDKDYIFVISKVRIELTFLKLLIMIQFCVSFRISPQRPHSPGPACVSMKSDRSMYRPTFFKGGHYSAGQG